MAPIDDYNTASQPTLGDEALFSILWPKPAFILAVGSVILLILLIRRHLTFRRYIDHFTDGKHQTDIEDPFSDLSPPLRSVYHHQLGKPTTSKSSSILAAEAGIRQLHQQERSKSPPIVPNRRHSCPSSSQPFNMEHLTHSPIEAFPPPYSELVHDEVQLFPILDGDGMAMRNGHWRRRTMIYG